MYKYKKLLCSVLACGMGLSLLTGCNVTNLLGQVKEPVVEETSEENISGVQAIAGNNEATRLEDVIGPSQPSVTEGTSVDYKSLYKEAINNEFGEEAFMYTYKLIYINDDDIPELYYSGYCEAVGSGILYIDPDQVVRIVYMSRIAGCYEPRANFFYHSQGHMGDYFDEFYGFVDGMFVLTDYGYVSYADNGTVDYMADPPSAVSFNDEDLSLDAYNAVIEDKLSGRDMVDLQEWVFTKDGAPIEDQEYWDHWGEEGYFGGTLLDSYDELMAQLSESNL